MKEQQPNLFKAWSNVNQPFQGGRQKFAAIPKDERSDFNKKILEVKKNPNPPPIIYKKDYPSTGVFTYQGYSLHYYELVNSISPKAILVHMHGLNSHGGGSGYFASVISNRNSQFNVYALDQMNFGRSDGPYRGQILSFQDSTQQGEQFVNYLLSKFKNKPKVFLCGSSYGGCIIFKMIINNPSNFTGAVLLAPALRNLAQSKPVMKWFGKALGCIIPRIRTFGQTYDSGTKYNMADTIRSDPYSYKEGVVPGSIRTILNAMDETSTMFPKFDAPYILFQSGIDKMVDPFAPLDLQQVSPSKDKTTIYCQNMWHAVFGEEQIDGIAWKTGQWLSKRI